jgi:hypothetical protein
MPPLLAKFFSNYTVSAIGFPLLLALAIFLLIRDVRAAKRGDPIKLWLLGQPVYPGDQLYNAALLARFGPYVAFVAVIVIVGGLIAWASIWRPQP